MENTQSGLPTVNLKYIPVQSLQKNKVYIRNLEKYINKKIQIYFQTFYFYL